MNKNFPIVTRHGTLKRYQLNYENDLKIFLEDYEDNNENDFLENDLFSHNNLLKNLLIKIPVGTKIDEGLINQRRINSQKRIIDFIENKISIKTTTSITQITQIVPSTENTLNWKGSELKFSELAKALFETKLISPELTQKEFFKRMKLLFSIDDFDEKEKLKIIRARSKDLTPFIGILENSLNNWIKNKD